MIVLNAIALCGVNSSLQATGAVTPKGGVGFMPIQDRHHQPVGGGFQGFHAFEAGVEMML